MTFTAYELRNHLAADHVVRMLGADYGTLLKVHEIEHRAGQDHTHEERSDAS